MYIVIMYVVYDDVCYIQVFSNESSVLFCFVSIVLLIIH